MTSEANASRGTGNEERAKSYIDRQDLILIVILTGMVVIFSLLNPRFFSLPALSNVLGDFGPVMLMAIGQTYVVISRGIDLSVGSVLGLSGVVMALVVRDMNAAGYAAEISISAGLLACLAMGVICGLVNGHLITRIHLDPFIATLVTMGAAAGLSIILTGGAQVAGAPRELILLGNTTLLSTFTVPVIAVLVITVIAWIFLRYSRFGRWTYAIGSNEFAARGAGIPVSRHLLKIYVLSGVMAALAGSFVYFRLGSGSPLSGRGGELTAIAATVIGGVNLHGGIGKLSGVILGALITTTVISGLIMIRVEPNWQQVVVASLIAFAVGMQGFAKSGARK